MFEGNEMIIGNVPGVEQAEDAETKVLAPPLEILEEDELPKLLLYLIEEHAWQAQDSVLVSGAILFELYPTMELFNAGGIKVVNDLIRREKLPPVDLGKEC